MPKNFKEKFKSKRLKANVRQLPNGSYEIRCQIQKHNISATAKYLDEAKAKFIQKLKDLSQALEAEQAAAAQIITGDYFLRWLELQKKPYVKENTYNEYIRLYHRTLASSVGEKPIETITTSELQGLINTYTEEEKFRTAKAIYQLLKSFFDYAVIDRVIRFSPMSKVRISSYEQKHGQALTRAEEYALRTEFVCNPTVRAQAVIFALYTGLRRSEFASISIDNEWITVSTSKQRKGKSKKLRKIPIGPLLKPLLPLISVDKIREVNPDDLTRFFRSNTHHFHDLRHTFITRCQECGIPRQIVSLWVGHTADTSLTAQVYTHLSINSELQLAEMQKFTYDFD